MVYFFADIWSSSCYESFSRYSITPEDFSNNFGSHLISNIYGNTPYKLLSTLYPDKDWLPWLFRRTPENIWDDPQTRLKFLKWLGDELGVKGMEDWYRLTRTIVVEKGGESLLSKFEGVHDLLSSSFSYHFLPWKFASLPHGYWEKKERRNEYIDWLVKEAGVSSWTELKRKHFDEHFGANLLGLYNRSLEAVLTSVSPQPPSSLSSFPNTSSSSVHGGNRSWAALEDQVKFAEDMAKIVGIKDPSGYRLPPLFLSFLCSPPPPPIDRFAFNI